MNKLHAYILSNSRNIQCRYADSEIVAAYVITDGLMHSLTYLENDKYYNFDFFFNTDCLIPFQNSNVHKRNNRIFIPT